ncbi:XRE family transcriptional regulator [Methylopila sp. M107]|uniref:helix-turn-helix domain-containing protein n=1 Tax=Methylopila sp. M107 TaxID=1101190 RepID=UPI00037E3DD3|nr:XRE family transcriptional regulator [Methylopila sp. M107]
MAQKPSRARSSDQKVTPKGAAVAEEPAKTAGLELVGFDPESEPYVTGSNAPAALARRTLEQAIGLQIRHHRKSMGLTVAELASAASVSNGMLSKIENGQISPSLTTLQTLATALNVPISLLFSEFEERRDCSFVPAGQGVTIQRRGTKVGHGYELLGHMLGGAIAVEPYLITLADDAAPYTAFQHEGTELIHILTGEVTYAHAGNSYDMKPGDTLLFDSGAPHGPERIGKTPLTYLSIIMYEKD